MGFVLVAVFLVAQPSGYLTKELTVCPTSGWAVDQRGQIAEF